MQNTSAICVKPCLTDSQGPTSIRRASARLVKSTRFLKSSMSAALVSSHSRRVSVRMKRSSNSLRSWRRQAGCKEVAPHAGSIGTCLTQSKLS